MVQAYGLTLSPFISYFSVKLWNHENIRETSFTRFIRNSPKYK